MACITVSPAFIKSRMLTRLALRALCEGEKRMGYVGCLSVWGSGLSDHIVENALVASCICTFIVC